MVWQGVFAAARALAPAVVFMDEVDALAPAREGGSGGSSSGTATSTSSASEASARLVTTLLTEMEAGGWEIQFAWLQDLW